jgi:hypothetical protein
MATNTYVQIASVTVGAGGAANIEFTSIPGTFDDLVLKVSIRDTEASVSNAFIFQFNGETATTNYSARWLYGTGAAAASLTRSGSSGQFWGESNSANSTASTFANVEFYIPNYAGSTNKSVSIDAVTENNATTAYQFLNAALWSNTTAISSILIKPNSGLNWVQHSTATLYGIKKS